jgi:hypothetical protein
MWTLAAVATATGGAHVWQRGEQILDEVATDRQWREPGKDASLTFEVLTVITED